MESLATKSFILYNLHGRSPKHHCTRVQRYCNRGFDFLEPKLFDGSFNHLMAEEEIPIYRTEKYQYVDDDGELQTAIVEIYRGNMENVDTYQLQDLFMTATCPQLLQNA